MSLNTLITTEYVEFSVERGCFRIELKSWITTYDGAPAINPIDQPFTGDALLFDVLNAHYQAIMHTQNDRWIDIHSYLIDVLNRTPDSGGATPAIRYYQFADARGPLFFAERYIELNGLVRIAEFLGYSKDGLSYHFKLANDNVVKVTRVHPVPVPASPRPGTPRPSPPHPESPHPPAGASSADPLGLQADIEKRSGPPVLPLHGEPDDPAVLRALKCLPDGADKYVDIYGWDPPADSGLKSIRRPAADPNQPCT